MNKRIEIKFKCQGSGNCCVSRGSHGFVYLTYKDIIRFSKFFKLNIIQFMEKYCFKTNNLFHLKEMNNNGNCIFLKKNKCSVYKARPEQCRTWPFWSENINPKGWKTEILKFCPGLGKGKFYSKKQWVII